MTNPMSIDGQSWSARVATELTKVAQVYLADGTTAAHAEVAADILAHASRYAKDAAREIRILGPAEEDPPF